MPNKKTTVAIIITAIILFVAGAWAGSSDEEYAGAGVSSVSIPGSCNVLVSTINGYLATYATDRDTEDYDVTSSGRVVEAIHAAGKNPHIKAFLLSIDSSGGDATTGEEIANALKALEKPSVALIRSVGASSAYWAATGADTIFASRISDVGSIGATASYLDESRKNAQEGYTYVELASAPHKNAGDPSRPLTAGERASILSDLKKIHEVFVDDVAANRNLDRKKVAELANGLTYLGVDALKHGLVDKLGDLTAVTDYLSEQIGEPVELCWY